MKNKPSDLEKAFRFTLPAIGIGFGLYFLATALSQITEAGSGEVFAAILMGFGFYLFIKPSEEKHKPRKLKTETDSGSRLNNLLMKKIYEAYNIKEEPESEEENDSEDESDEDVDSEDNVKDKNDGGDESNEDADSEDDVVNESNSSNESDEDADSEDNVKDKNDGGDESNEDADSEDDAEDKNDSGDESNEDADSEDDVANESNSSNESDEDADSEDDDDEEESDDEADEDIGGVSSDLEKAFRFLLPALGGYLMLCILTTVLSQVAGAGSGGVFVAILIVFSVILMGVGFYFSIKLSEGKRKPHRSKMETDSDNELSDEDIDGEDDVKDENDSDDESDEDIDGEDDVEDENDSDDESDEDANSENDIEDKNDSEDDIEEEEKHPTFQDSKVEKTKIYPVAVIYDGSEENTENWLKILISPVQLPITISAAWFVIVIVIYNFFPDTAKSISKLASPSIFTVLPILFLLGLNGFLGILLKQPSESLETTPKEKFDYMMNVFKILAGWGTGVYALWVYLQNI